MTSKILCGGFSSDLWLIVSTCHKVQRLQGQTWFIPSTFNLCQLKTIITILKRFCSQRHKNWPKTENLIRSICWYHEIHKSYYRYLNLQLRKSGTNQSIFIVHAKMSFLAGNSNQIFQARLKFRHRRNGNNR